MPEALRKDVTDRPQRLRHFAVPVSWLEQEDWRLDATTYTKEAFDALLALKGSRWGTQPLSTLVKRVYHPTENQPRSNFKRIWATPDEGIPFLTGRQLLFFRPDTDKYLSRAMPKLPELRVDSGSILVSRSGSTGFPVLVGEWLSRFAITDDALRVVPGTSPIGFIYAFLLSPFTKALLDKGEYGKVVSHIEATHVASLPVPLIPDTEQQSIHEKMMQACALRDRANEALDEADRALHELLGVPRFTESDVEYLGGGCPKAFAVKSQDLGVRLDATHHVPLARSAVHKLAQGRFPLSSLAELVGDKKIVVPPRFARIYVNEEYGTPLLQGSQLPLARSKNLGFISTDHTKDLARWIIRSGWVLVTCSGTIGRVAVATKMQDGWAASQHILRIKLEGCDLRPGFLTAFLTTAFGQHQLNAKVYGGVVAELTSADTGAIIVPVVPPSLQEPIASAVENAFENRDRAAAIEQAAIEELSAAIRA